MGLPRVYKSWPGNNRFFCYGKLITGPEIQTTAVSFLLIVIPVALFLAFP